MTPAVEAILNDFKNAAIANNLVWKDPHVSSCEDDITIEWHHKKRELHIEIDESQPLYYVKVWGINIVTEMESGMLDKEIYGELLQWLYCNKDAERMQKE